MHDLTFFLPQNYAQKLYVKILSSSLEHFLVRYSSATPSEFRTSHIFCDLYAILLCTSELLWPACSSSFQYMGKKQEMAENPSECFISKIHSSCCFLLAILVVLTAPICEVFKVFKGGFPQAGLSVRTKYESVSPWLPWIRRELFSEFCQRQIVSNVSVWLAVRACISWNLPNPAAVVQAYTEHSCTLSILLMMQVANSSISPPKEDAHSHNLTEASKVKLSYYLISLLIHYDNYNHLHDILLPVIEKKKGWLYFDSAAVNKSISEKSWWYRGLVKTLHPYLVGVFEEVMPLWLDISKKCSDPMALKSFNTLKSDLQNHIVCVCEKDPLNSMQEEFNPTDEIVSFVCLRKVLESMHRNIISLPQALKLYLLSLDLHISNYIPEIQSVHKSLPLQILLSSAIDFLRDNNFVTNIPDIKKLASVTANVLESILCDEEFFFENESNTKMIAMLLSSIHANFKDVRKELEKVSETTHIKEIKEEILEITVHKILQLPEGNDIILYLHQILKQNEIWIQKSLGIPGMLSSDIVVNPLTPSPLLNSCDSQEVEHKEKDFISFKEIKSSSQAYVDVHSSNQGASYDSDPQQEIRNSFSNFNGNDFEENIDILNLEVQDSIVETEFNFNPLDCFNKLGESTFRKVGMELPVLPWEAILSHLPILGLTETNFCTILSHRWDIRNEGPLTTEESNCVEELKAIYKII
ncbi:hypothetical protein CDAR_199531 [Caerostris darwini]|nr:hypothetical protein CDAR_199531 [Caerostris darwini]